MHRVSYSTTIQVHAPRNRTATITTSILTSHPNTFWQGTYHVSGRKRLDERTSRLVHRGGEDKSKEVGHSPGEIRRFSRSGQGGFAKPIIYTVFGWYKRWRETVVALEVMMGCRLQFSLRIVEIPVLAKIDSRFMSTLENKSSTLTKGAHFKPNSHVAIPLTVVLITLISQNRKSLRTKKLHHHIPQRLFSGDQRKSTGCDARLKPASFYYFCFRTLIFKPGTG